MSQLSDYDKQFLLSDPKDFPHELREIVESGEDLEQLLEKNPTAAKIIRYYQKGFGLEISHIIKNI